MQLTLGNSRSLVSLLKALQPHNHGASGSSGATTQGGAQGERNGGASKLRVLVQTSRERSGLVLAALLPHRTCQLNALLPMDAFTVFDDNHLGQQHEPVTLCVDLDALIETVSIFGGESAQPFAFADSDHSSTDNHPNHPPRAGGIGVGGMAGAPKNYHHTQSHHNHQRDAGQNIVSLSITYDPANSTDLVVNLKHAGVKSVAKLKTMDVESTLEELEELENQFSANEVACKIMMKSVWLSHAISELDPTTDTFRIHVRPRAPHLRISCKGMAGETVVEYVGNDGGAPAFSPDADDHDALESVECFVPDDGDTDGVQFDYKYSVVQPALKQLLTLSAKVSMRINTEGIMSMQFMVPVQASEGGGNNPSQMGCVNFVCLPDVGADRE